MDIAKFVQNLTNQQKITLVQGDGSWYTHSVDGLPAIMMTDGPHGLRKQQNNCENINDSNKATCFPTACAVATSWNRQNARAIGNAIAREAIAEDVSVVLGPGVNVKRSPLCGRNFEYYSEDPFLAGELAVSHINAMQSCGVGACAKHFAVNSQETRRMTVDAIVDQRALREIYLSAFERIVKKAQPYTVMSAYNKLNGYSCTLNKHLLTDVLRKEWGFEGLVMSDWGACYNMAEGINAGMDLEMPNGGKLHERCYWDALQDGTLNEQALDRACYNVVNLAQKCSLPKQKIDVDYLAHHKLCRQISADSAVLLKNEGILPLSADKKILVVGEMALKPRYQGAGSSHINTTCADFLTVLAQNDVPFDYAQGYSVQGDSFNQKLADQAVQMASQHDVVLFFGGLTDDFEGEGYDRSKLDIPTCQQKVLSMVSQANPNVVFVAFGGSPFAMPWLKHAKALLNMYLGGEAVMEGAFDLLFGKVNPSGRLAESYPHNLTETPCFNYFANDRHLDEHRESIFVGYRYYNTFGVPVLFPFGYGLSYTNFAYGNFAVNKSENGYVASLTVTNQGNVDGAHVVQIYVDNAQCGYMRAKRELRGFDKVFVKAGQSVAVQIPLDEHAFDIFLNGSWTTVPGTYTVSVGSDVENLLDSVQIVVEGDFAFGNDEQLYPCYFQEVQGSFFVNEEQFYALCGMQKPTFEQVKRGNFTLLNTFEDMRDQVGLVRLVLKYVKRMAKKQAPSHSFSDPVAQMIYSGSLETPLISMMSVGGQSANLMMFILHHANKHPLKALKALFGKW